MFKVFLNLSRSTGLPCLVFALAFLCNFLISSLAWGSEQDKENFLKDVRSTLNQKDPKAFAQLFNWEGVSQKTKATLDKHLFSSLFDGEVESVQFKPLPEGFRSEYVLSGIRTYTMSKFWVLSKFNIKRENMAETKRVFLMEKRGVNIILQAPFRRQSAKTHPKASRFKSLLSG